MPRVTANTSPASPTIEGEFKMPTSTQLASGLGGAIGCDFRTAQNQLVFVEYATGKLSALNLFPPSTIVAQSASTVLNGGN